MNNLKGFASKLKVEAAKQAAKLPSFDDMAANDDYIHSEEFNVKGNKRPAQATASVTSSAVEISSNASDSESKTSSTAWSLIDRRITNNTTANSAASSLVNFSQNSVGSQSQSSTTLVSEVQSLSNVQSSEIPPSAVKQPIMLSVVADALRAGEEEVQSDSEVSIESSSNNSRNYGSSDDEADDEDDPILLLMRQSQPQQQQREQKTRTRTNKKNRTKKKNPNRFLTDVEDQSMPSQQTAQTSQNVTSSRIVEVLPTNPREFGKWVKSMASNQVSKILRPEIPKKLFSAAPLASNRVTTTAPVRQRDDEFGTADSSAFLGDDELAELAKMKQQSKQQGLASLVMESFMENRHFAFIFLTLMLAAIVYFYSSKKIENNVL